MGWELHNKNRKLVSIVQAIQSVVRNGSSLLDDDKEPSIDRKNGSFLQYGVVKMNTMNLGLIGMMEGFRLKHPDEVLYCKMLQIAEVECCSC